jgi:hypothetical protein
MCMDRVFELHDDRCPLSSPLLPTGCVASKPRERLPRFFATSTEKVYSIFIVTHLTFLFMFDVRLIYFFKKI